MLRWLGILFFSCRLFSSSPSVIYNTVNVITGEYCEVDCDLSIPGCKPLEIQRTFKDVWKFNYPNIFDNNPNVYDGNLTSHQLLLYDYDQYKRLIAVKSTDFLGNNCYQQLNFQYINSIQNPICLVNGSDGQQVTYKFQSKGLMPGLPPYLLDEVIDRSGLVTKYRYCKHPSDNKKTLISSKERSDGQFLKTEYDEKGRVVKQYAPLGSNKTPVLKHQLTYRTGQTEVIDALGQKAVYFHEKEHLTAIEHYEGNKLYKKECFYWNNASPACLTARSIVDAQGTVHACRTFAYDDHGNLITETLYGNLSGKCNWPIILNAMGCPIENGVEHYSVHYHYSNEKEPRLVRKIEDNGNFTFFVYDKKNVKAKLIGNGETIKLRNFYSYDGNNCLIASILDDGSTINVENLTGVTERHITRYALQSSGPAFGLPETISEYALNLATGEELNIKKVKNSYSPSGQLIEQTLYNSLGEPYKTITINYNAFGHPSDIVTSNGEIIHKEYDLKGNVIQETTISKEGKQTHKSSVFDHLNRLIVSEEHGEKSQRKEQRYDYLGNCLSSRDICGHETTYEYDLFGRMVAKTASGHSEYYQYDILGNLVTHRDANGHATTTTYNARGKPTQKNYPDGTTETFEYALDGSLSKAIAKDKTSRQYEYDYLARPTAVYLNDADGVLKKVSKAVYSGFRVLRQQESGLPETILSYTPDGKCCSMQKFDQGHLISKNQLFYDPQGALVKELTWYEDAPNAYRTTLYKRDASGELIEKRIEDAHGNVLKQETFKKPDPTSKEYLYGENQQIISVDSSGFKVITTLNSAAKVSSIEKRDLLGHLIARQEMLYDGVGNKISETHALIQQGKITGEQRTEWHYDSANRVTCLIEAVGTPQQMTTHYHYNHIGKLAKVTQPNGISIIYTYDSLARLSSISSTDRTIDYQYHYDAAGRISTVEDLLKGTVTKRTYNAAGEPIHETLGNGLSIDRSYDLLGRKQTIIFSDHSSVHYTYDAAHLATVKRLSNEGECLYQHQYSRDNAGNSLSCLLANDTGNLRTQYDSSNRLIGLSSPYFEQKIEYNSEGNIAKLETNQQIEEYQYDARQQLTQEGKHHYQYDSLFNCLQKDQTINRYDSAHRLIQSGLTSYHYNQNGCLVKKCSPESTVEYSYDALNRLTKIKNGSSTIHYEYDAFNRRLSKSTGEHEKTLYLYDEHCEIGSKQGEQTELRILGEETGCETGAAIAIELNSELYIPIHDHRGSIVCLVDQSKQIAQQYSYSAFGEVSAENCLNNPWQFVGKRHDPESGLIYFGQRFYDPEIGRWLTPDPIGFPDGPNRYSYLLNNPLNGYDQWGHFSVSEIWTNFVQELVSFYNTVVGLESFRDRDLQREFAGIAEELFGSTFLTMSGYYSSGDVAYGVYGEDEISPKVRVTALNGLLNLHEHWISSIELMSKTHGNVRVHYIFDPSAGWTGDAVKGFLAKCGYVSPAAKLLAKTWKNLIQEMGGVNGGGVIVHYAHSIGGTNTSIARDLLTPEEQRMIKVITIGSATLIPNGGFQSVVNYVSYRDFVGLFDPVRYFGSLFNSSNIVHIGSHAGIPLIDHLMGMETYARLLAMLGSQFLQSYAD